MMVGRCICEVEGRIMIEDTKLSSSVTIVQYRELKARKDRKEIAKFV